MTKKVEITLLEDNVLSIDGQTKPAGSIHIEDCNMHIEEYVNDELVGGCYATYENVSDKLKEFFEN